FLIQRERAAMPKIDDAELARFQRARIEWDASSTGYVKWVTPFETPHGAKYSVHVGIHADMQLERVTKMQKVPGGGDKREAVEVNVKTRHWEALHVRYDQEPFRLGDQPFYFWYTFNGIFRETPSQRRGLTREEAELK